MWPTCCGLSRSRVGPGDECGSAAGMSPTDERCALIASPFNFRSDRGAGVDGALFERRNGPHRVRLPVRAAPTE